MQGLFEASEDIFAGLKITNQDDIFNGVKSFIQSLLTSNQELRTYHGVVAWYDFDKRVVYMSSGDREVSCFDLAKSPKYSIEEELFRLVKFNINNDYFNLSANMYNEVRSSLDQLRSDGKDLITANIVGMECIYNASTGMVTIVMGEETATLGTEGTDDISTITDLVLYYRRRLDWSNTFFENEEKRKCLLAKLVDGYNKNKSNGRANPIYMDCDEKSSTIVYLDEGREIGFASITSHDKAPIGFVMTGFNHVSLWALANRLSENT